ncbi:hypothetical protein JN12_02092 [Geobacter argillaceus]|uniref:Doubled CXXCH motif domain-containing protein n=1 Tax=Geobacter argillaceus TaxID=345631 RepID=A0A562VMM7_9BACT|nr:hypothetical protein JN12_02092 [Geobacter argillaceus]
MSVLSLLFTLLFCAVPVSLHAVGPKISQIGNKHNLASWNTAVTYRAVVNPNDPSQRHTQICVFCHTPHHASGSAVLWNRSDPTRTFGHFSSPTLVIDNPDVRTSKSMYGEPNGSSRLCLSCHDGQTALGVVFNGAAIAFPAGLSTLPYMRYSSHHPVSFVYDTSVLAAITLKKPLEGYRLPTDSPSASFVKLDQQKRLQCVSCHDPHQDQSVTPSVVSPFWVGPDHDTVCKACHNVQTLPVLPP